MSLIAPSELLKAHEKYEREQAAKESALAASGFQYTPRTRTQWRLRTDQTRDGSPAVEPVTVGATPTKTKISAKTKCLCGHTRNMHCTGDPKLHTPSGGEGFWCTTEHCEGSTWDGNKMQPCDCMGFRISATDTPKLKHPKADDYTPCGHCGHWR